METRRIFTPKRGEGLTTPKLPRLTDAIKVKPAAKSKRAAPRSNASEWAVARWGLISIRKVITEPGGNDAFKLAWIANLVNAIEMFTKKPLE